MLFFFVAEIYAELGLSQVLIKEGEIEVPRPTEEDKELERKEKLTLLELEVCFFNITIQHYFHINLCVILGK